MQDTIIHVLEVVAGLSAYNLLKAFYRLVDRLIEPTNNKDVEEEPNVNLVYIIERGFGYVTHYWMAPYSKIYWAHSHLKSLINDPNSNCWSKNLDNARQFYSLSEATKYNEDLELKGRVGKYIKKPNKPTLNKG